MIRVASVVVVEVVSEDLHGSALQKVVDVRCVEGLGVRVGAHAHGLAQTERECTQTWKRFVSAVTVNTLLETFQNM